MVAPIEEVDEEYQERAYRNALEPFDPNVDEEEGIQEEWEDQDQTGRALAVPEAPSRKEQEEHAVTHWPFRKLCDH